MNYYINPASLSAVFMMPTAVVDRHLKLAKAEHIKILLYLMRNMSEEIDESTIANACDVTETDVKEALLYWADSEILLPKSQTATPPKEATSKTTKKRERPTRQDVLKRFDDPKVKFLMREGEMKFGRSLKSTEKSSLLWIYDDLGLDVSVIALILQHAVAKDRINITYIEAIATDWVKKGIDTIALADEELKRLTICDQAWNVVSNAFGLEKRKPSQKETELSFLWLNTWQFPKEMLELAYEECVNAKSKFSFPYTAKILENWHKKGYKKPEDIEDNKPSGDDNFAAYDLDLFEKMLNSKD